MQQITATAAKATSGWLLSLDPQSLNDCCDREQTMKNITGHFLGRKI